MNSRFVAIDLARGIAMLGVALVNIHAFAVSWSQHYALDLASKPWDVFAEYFVATLFTHRSYPVLAFLFGAGLWMQWARLSEARRRPRDLRPRLWALLVLGVIHGVVLWPGDVLSTYAVVGLICVAILKGRSRRIGITAVSILCILMLLYASFGVGMIASAQEPYPWPWPESSSFSALSWRTALATHPGEYLERGLAQIFVFDIWAWVLLGMWAAASGRLQDFLAAPLGRPSYVVVGVAALMIGAGMEYYAAGHGGWDARMYNDIGSGWMTLAILPASLGGLWLWLTLAAYASRHVSLTRGLASFVHATGRAPLTQFFGQSIVFALIFNKSLIGWHGELGRFAYSMIAIMTYGLLSGFIRAWLASGHAHGPMETVWRGLTRRLSGARRDEAR